MPTRSPRSTCARWARCIRSSRRSIRRRSEFVNCRRGGKAKRAHHSPHYFKFGGHGAVAPLPALLIAVQKSHCSPRFLRRQERTLVSDSKPVQFVFKRKTKEKR